MSNVMLKIQLRGESNGRAILTVEGDDFNATISADKAKYPSPVHVGYVIKQIGEAMMTDPGHGGVVDGNDLEKLFGRPGDVIRGQALVDFLSQMLTAPPAPAKTERPARPPRVTKREPTNPLPRKRR